MLPESFYLEQWSAVDESQRQRFASYFQANICSRLGKGVFDFASLPELFKALGIRHVPNPSAELKGQFGSACPSSMSHKTFKRVVYLCDGLRLEQHPNIAVERECKPRIRLVIN